MCFVVFCFGECLNIPVVLLRTSATCTGTWRFASQEGKVPPEAVQLQRTMEELSGDFGTSQFAVDVFDLGNFAKFAMENHHFLILYNSQIYYSY